MALPQPPELSAIDSDAGEVGKVQPDDAAKKEAHTHRTARLAVFREFHRWLIWGLRVAALVMIVIGVIRAFHLIAPDGWCWLTTERLQTLDKILFSGAIGGMIGRSLNRIVESKD